MERTGKNNYQATLSYLRKQRRIHNAEGRSGRRYPVEAEKKKIKCWIDAGRKKERDNVK
jgi:hypothetical protein